MIKNFVTWQERYNSAIIILDTLARAAKLHLDLLAIAKLTPEHVDAKQIEAARFDLDFLATMHLLPTVTTNDPTQPNPTRSNDRDHQ